MNGVDANGKGGAIRDATRAIRIAAFLAPFSILSAVAVWIVQPAPGFGSLRDATHDLTSGPGPNNDLVGAHGWLRDRLGIGSGSGHEIDQPNRTISRDEVTLKLTRQQAEQLLGLLRSAISDADQRADPKATLSDSQTAPAEDRALTPNRAELAAQISINTASTQPQPQSRLSLATPLILTFIGASSAIVVLMMYAGILLIRAGATSGGAKVEFLGMKIDAKGSGIAAIACGSLVLLATFRPLIDAVVSLSQS